MFSHLAPIATADLKFKLLTSISGKSANTVILGDVYYLTVLIGKPNPNTGEGHHTLLQ